MQHDAFIAIEPKPKGNAQRIVNGRGGRPMVIPDRKVRAKQKEVALLLQANAPARQLSGAVRLDVVFVLPIAASWPQWKRAAAAAGVLFPYTGKATKGGGVPDRGNLLKLIEDAAEAAGWLANDSQICAGDVSKVYGATPGYRLRLLELDECLTRADWLARLATEQCEQRSP